MEKAADACLEAIDMAHAQNKRLYTSVDPLLSTQNDTFKLQTTLRQAICDRWNCELIWGSTNNDQYSFVQRCQSRVLRVGAEMGTVVRTEWAPTLNTVEKFAIHPMAYLSMKIETGYRTTGIANVTKFVRKSLPVLKSIM